MSLEVVLVVWRDAHADQTCSSWCSISELADDGDYLVSTVGWLITGADGRDCKQGHVTLAQSCGAPAGTRAVGDCLIDSVLHIPRENVLQIRSLHRHESIGCDE